MKNLPPAVIHMYDRVVLAVDSSEEAKQAARTGFAFAGLIDAPVAIVHVLERSLLDALRSSNDRNRIREERRELLRNIESIAGDTDVETTTNLLEGQPAARISAFAADQPNPVIVLGRQGRSTVSRKLLGGVTEKVLGSGDTPVLVEPGTESKSARFAPTDLLVPTDGSENAEAAIPHATAIANETEGRVHLLSVLDLQQAGGVFNAGGLETEFVERLEGDARAAIESGHDLVRNQDSGIALTTKLERSSDFDGIAGGIESYARLQDIDLIVMGSHGRSNVKRQLLGSVTATVLRSVDVPVLVVPRAKK